MPCVTVLHGMFWLVDACTIALVQRSKKLSLLRPCVAAPIALAVSDLATSAVHSAVILAMRSIVLTHRTTSSLKLSRLRSFDCFDCFDFLCWSLCLLHLHPLLLGIHPPGRCLNRPCGFLRCGCCGCCLGASLSTMRGAISFSLGAINLTPQISPAAAARYVASSQ